MQKSRSLSLDLGDRADGKYWSTSSLITLNGGPYLDILSNPSPYYLEGLSKANTATGFTIRTGSESLESTTRSKRYFNNCTHLTHKGFDYPFLQVKLYPSYSANAGLTQYYRWSSNAGPADLLPLTSEYTWADCDDIQRRAWWSMQPRWESEFSMLNFIYELKDFKSYVKLYREVKERGLFSLIYSVMSNIRRMQKEAKFAADAAKTSAAATKILAEAHLAMEFAVKPLISDVSEFMRIMTETVDACQEEFKTRGEFYQISHYTEVLDDLFVGSYYTKGNANVFNGKRRLATFTATLEYSYDYELRKGWDAYKRYLGLEFTTEVLWNALPFTFLLDYVYKVGEALHYMTLDPNVSTHVFQYCESFLIYASAGIGFDTSSALVKKLYMPCNRKYNEATKGFVAVSGYSGEWYRRRVMLPNRGAALPRTTSASTKQMWNIAALVRGFLG